MTSVESKAIGWLKDAFIDTERARTKLQEAMDYIGPPYKDDVRKIISDLRRISCVINDDLPGLIEEKSHAHCQ